MIGEQIEAILNPKKDGWFILQTDKQSYFLRLGGVSDADFVDLNKYDKVDFPLINKIITRVLTDDFLILIETAEGDALKHSSNASIDSHGSTYFGVTYLSKESYKEIKEDYGNLLVEIK